MGVRGLKSLIEKNDDLFVNHFHLHDTLVVVDASNLISALYRESQKHERRDLFGGDMVQFGCYLNTFFNNMRKCGIEPILVFDGAQTYDQNKSKTAEKHRRALERFQSVLSITRCGFGDFILPATATNVFRSIAVDRKLRIIQCMYEADPEIARISNEMRCPVLSNDSDFFLMDLEHGVLTIDLLDHETVRRNQASYSSEKPTDCDPSVLSYLYIECSLFRQEHFKRYLPHLDTRNLPLLGVLAGNDFIDSRVFDRLCGRMSTSRFGSARQFKKANNRQHEKILRILHFLSGKTLDETVNQICSNVPKERRMRIRQLIKANLCVYDVPTNDDFELELMRLYWPGFKSTQNGNLNFARHDEALRLEFAVTIKQVEEWLRRAMEKSVLSYRCLELANNNIIFIICNLDDPQLPSAHLCQIRPMRVMLALLRSKLNESNSYSVYYRVGADYSKQIIKPLDHLENFGKLDHTLFDVPKLNLETRRAILLATFHCTFELFETLLECYYEWLEPGHAEEFLMIKLLMDYIDYENQQVRLWKHFRQATLLCILYHYHKDQSDGRLLERLAERDNRSLEFMDRLVKLIKSRGFSRMPVLHQRGRLYNCRLMHQTTQLQSSIVSFNGLNAFLGDPAIRIRTENWLNSCIIYNLAEGLHYKTLKLGEMPEIVHNQARAVDRPETGRASLAPT